MGRNIFFRIAFGALVLTTGLVLLVNLRGEPRVLHTNLEKLPMTIADYKGTVDAFDQSIYDALGADLHLYRHYQSTQGATLSLYIGYYGTAKGGRTGHNPFACLPGAGWGIIEADKVTVYPDHHPEGVSVNYVVARKDGINNLMLHWYQTAGDRVLSTGLQQNIERFRGRVLHNRNDGAYVQVNTLVREDNVTAEKERVCLFVQEVLELLPDYWPIEG
ncbi:EpsI family protein [Desulfuromonas sp. KJ2020]|uniref:exosortase C-terminal domain/associated protein EpsI n=1 Tax=Desulfuromonas sp. KJ2020 TaxID=2919173 RepID=UPI0020A82ABA|nr:exosortase C-terminal domain/associated protein EpsI [Desulfuromonas sp. KJ2020]MCP3178149.1 EpsI family protein [Desulfuromonas sp. KJ2020]